MKGGNMKLTWPCGGKSGLGCGKEVFGGVGQVLKVGRASKKSTGNEVFHIGCAEKVRGIRK